MPEGKVEVARCAPLRRLTQIFVDTVQAFYVRRAALAGAKDAKTGAVTAVQRACRLVHLTQRNRSITVRFVFSIKRTDEFNAWLCSLKDGLTHRRLLGRLRKATLGNLGDVKPVGQGVFEMREHFGSGWRMYYLQRGAVLIVMLGGGDKSTQAKDIAKAVKLAATIEE